MSENQIESNFSEEKAILLDVLKLTQKSDKKSIRVSSERHLKNKFKSNEKAVDLSSKKNGFVCYIKSCGKVLSSESTLRAHLKRHLNEDKRYKCDVESCVFSTEDKNRLTEHMNSHNGIKPFECSSCGKRFTSNRFRNNHINHMHKLSDQLLVCDLEDCHKTFKTERSLKVHKNLYHIKGKSFPCDDPNCNYWTISESLLQYHKSSNHSSEPIFKCHFDGCVKTFSTPYILKAHLKSHTNEFPFKCPNGGCDKSFRYSQSLHRHKKSKHSGIRHVCEWPGCGFTTSLKESLDLHSALHTDAFNYVCNWKGCDKRFKQKVYFNRHMAKHWKSAVPVNIDTESTSASSFDIQSKV